MPDIPAENYALQWSGGTRAPLPLVGGERQLLTAFLDWHRATLEMKCVDVAIERVSARVVPPSRLSLHGLVRHLAGVERWWFRQQFAGEDVEHLFYTDDNPDDDFDSLHGDFAHALAAWRAECERSREVVAAASLDQTGIRKRTDEPVSLRYVLLHMIAEYARHNGHADLLRERIDGATGF